MKVLSNKKYDMLIIENESLKEIRENDNWCINMLGDKIKELEEKNKKLKEKVIFLEECLDRKEKVNKSLREELDNRKSTFVYDAKKVRDVL